jgi:hypothetical protein
MRAGRLERARRDLDIAAEEAPGCSMRVFYEALLASAEGKPYHARQKLEELSTMSFAPARDNAWVRQFYPEVLPYAQDPGFELFRDHRER